MKDSDIFNKEDSKNKIINNDIQEKKDIEINKINEEQK